MNYNTFRRKFAEMKRMGGNVFVDFVVRQPTHTPNYNEQTSVIAINYSTNESVHYFKDRRLYLKMPNGETEELYMSDVTDVY